MEIKLSKFMAGLLLIIYATSISAQQASTKSDSALVERDFQFSFVPGMGTSEGISENYINRISLNLLVGHENGFDGLELGGIYNVNKYNGHGAQFAGIGNHIRGNMTGIQFGGINTLGGDLTGAQWSYFINYSKGNVIGFQASDFMNIAKGNVKGAQMAGFLNYVKGDIKGAQFSTGINIAQNITGSQFGIINIADSLEHGVAIGLINIIKNGLIQGGIETNDIIDANLTFRSGTTQLYSILQLGIDLNDSEIWSYGGGFGTQMTLKNKFKGNLELTTQSVQRSDHMDDLNLVNRLSYNFGFQFAKHLTISAGPALNVYVSNMKNADASYGFDFGQNTLYDTTDGNYNVQMWVGYNVAIKF